MNNSGMSFGAMQAGGIPVRIRKGEGRKTPLGRAADFLKQKKAERDVVDAQKGGPKIPIDERFGMTRVRKSK